MTEPLPLRLGYLVSRYPAISHTFVLREVLALASHGIQIETASINPPDRPRKDLTFDEKQEAERTYYVKEVSGLSALGINVAYLVKHPVRYAKAMLFALQLAKADIAKLLFGLFYLAEAALLAQWMRERGIRHLHVHFATPAATVALFLSKLTTLEFSFTLHGPDELYDVPGYYLAEKIARARFVCAIGQYARSQLMRISPVEQWDKFEVAPLGVNPQQFAPRPFRPEPELFEVLCVGRLVPAKGQHILLKSVARLLKQGRNVCLRLVGDGPDRPSLEREVQALGIGGAVRFEGSVNQDRIRGFYQTADVFGLASFAEGIPVVLMEAMAMEIPCVTTWITGVPELIRSEVDGLLVAPSDAAGLAEAIGRLMDDAPLRKRLGEAGRARVLDKYHLAENVSHLAEIFHRRLGICA